MSHTTRRSFLTTALTCVSCAGLAPLLRAQEVQPGIKHRFIVADYSHCTAQYIDQFDPSKNWSFKLAEIPYDMQLDGPNRLIANRTKGYDIYDLTTHKLIESVLDPKIKDIVRSFCIRADGHVFLATQKGPVYEYGPKRELITIHQMPKEVSVVRCMRLTQEGTALIAFVNGVYEVSLEKGLESKKRVIHYYKVPPYKIPKEKGHPNPGLEGRNPFVAQIAPDGKVLVSGGYARALLVFSRDGKYLCKTAMPQVEGGHDHYYSGFQILANGNTVLSQWTGYTEKDKRPGLKLVEFDKNLKPVWTWDDPAVGTINHVIVLQ